MPDKSLQPCATCPWRVDKDATTIPRYSHEKACGLLNTVGDGDDFRRIMACHHSTGAESEAERACKGYLAKVGYTNLNVRILAMEGKINLCEVEDACDGLALETDYQTVLNKLTRSITTDNNEGTT